MRSTDELLRNRKPGARRSRFKYPSATGYSWLAYHVPFQFSGALRYPGFLAEPRL